MKAIEEFITSYVNNSKIGHFQHFKYENSFGLFNIFITITPKGQLIVGVVVSDEISKIFIEDLYDPDSIKSIKHKINNYISDNFTTI